MRMEATKEAGTPSRILLLTHSRTASHLLAKMLSKQPNCVYGSHWFAIKPRELQKAIRKLELDGHPDQDLNLQLLTIFKECNVDMINFFNEAERTGKIIFIHNQPHTIVAPKLSVERLGGPKFSPEDHKFWFVGEPNKAHTNFTILPDEDFLYPGTQPIISFRHPVLIVEGLRRGLVGAPTYSTDWEGMKLHLRMGSNLRYMREMYDWYMEKGAPLNIRPILVEADDYMGPHKEKVMGELCEQAGLDASSVIYTWPKATEEEVHTLPPVMQHAFKTINSSEGILTGKSAVERDLDAEVASWEDKFGKESADLMKVGVKEMMPDYDYLRARRTVGV